MMTRDIWLHQFTPGGGKHVEMRRERDGNVAPSHSEGWWLICRSATERTAKSALGAPRVLGGERWNDVKE
jgi:hypothetical protein